MIEDTFAAPLTDTKSLCGYDFRKNGPLHELVRGGGLQQEFVLQKETLNLEVKPVI